MVAVLTGENGPLSGTAGNKVVVVGAIGDRGNTVAEVELLRKSSCSHNKVELGRRMEGHFCTSPKGYSNNLI